MLFGSVFQHLFVCINAHVINAYALYTQVNFVENHALYSCYDMTA
jgi:hypothetical protein